MKVLALGMSRSGTESLREALQILGYDHVYHGFDVPENDPQTFKAWVKLARKKLGTAGHITAKRRQDGEASFSATDFDPILSHCNAITDQQGAIFAKELIQSYPEAKVILNWRDSTDWYSSISRTFGVHMTGFRHHILPYFHPRLYWRLRYYVEVLDRYFDGSLMLNGKRVYKEHCAKIRGLLHEQPEKLLCWRVQDGWEPLCAFLEKDVPAVEFPSGNLPAETLNRVGAYLKEDERQAMRNLMCIATVVMMLLVAVYWVL